MKKEYLTPSVDVTELDLCASLLAGSTGGTVSDPDDEEVTIGQLYMNNQTDRQLC